jgi:hypothetical protein
MRHAILFLFVAPLGCTGAMSDSPDPGPDPDPDPDPTPIGEVTYHEDVAPLIAENCLGCHVEGGIGSGYAVLETYADAVEHASMMASKTAAREMPPYLADNSGACNTFSGARWLDDDEIAVFDAWLDQGTPEGPAPATPPQPVPLPDLAGATHEVRMAEPYTPFVGEDDDYRCFVVDPQLAADGWLTAFQVRPGQTSVVHHVILFALDVAEAETEAISRDAAAEGPGYPCSGGSGVTAGNRFVAGWTPGGGAVWFPEGTGLELPGARKMVMQIHYNTAAGTVADQTSIDLVVAPSVTKRALIVAVTNTSMSLDAGMEYVETEARLQVPSGAGEVKVWGLAPHMHLMGRAARMETASTCLIDVPRYDFHWQQMFFYDAPVTVRGGEMVTLTCGYDTTEATTSTVTWGEDTDEEMCAGFLYVTQ